MKFKALFNLLICLSFAFAASSQSSKVDEPKKVLSLNPGLDNPRNSEGDFIALKEGPNMFVYSKYYGESTSDHAPASLAARYSKDQGNTWSAEDRTIV
ncbi:hypothetical protein [Arenibacter certesii]|nr:hypothetical protein [Arenibacter certesii]